MYVWTHNAKLASWRMRTPVVFMCICVCMSVCSENIQNNTIFYLKGIRGYFFKLLPETHVKSCPQKMAW